jgi:site-specific DNA recombinase
MSSKVMSPVSVASFSRWVQTSVPRSRRLGRRGRLDTGGVRFAFYGRISTVRYQDPMSSLAWQLEAAGRLVAGRGRIVVTFFDAGASRSMPWPRRPQAAALLAAAADPDREFDAVVVGEFERAFAAGQAQSVTAQLNAHGRQVWLPELLGPVDLTEPDHRAMLMMLGHQSEREVLRNRFRTLAAMAAQVREQGRNQGGRPPYGYCLADAGPHPKKVHARWGRQAYRIEVDPVTAPHVRWIFAWRLDGWSAAGIARVLNEHRVPSPGVYDQARNPHRQETVWTLRTVAAILANPRYTGRQVWNRQFTDHREAVPGDKRSSLGPVRVWNSRADWVISAKPTHSALVSDEDFLAARRLLAVARPADGLGRRYAFTGLLICGVCGRRLVAHWVHGKPGYRCRHGRTSAHPVSVGGSRGAYWPQGELFRMARASRVNFAFFEVPDELASFLRVNELVIVCGARASRSRRLSRRLRRTQRPASKSSRSANNRQRPSMPRKTKAERTPAPRKRKRPVARCSWRCPALCPTAGGAAAQSPGRNARRRPERENRKTPRGLTVKRE